MHPIKIIQFVVAYHFNNIYYCRPFRSSTPNNFVALLHLKHTSQDTQFSNQTCVLIKHSLAHTLVSPIDNPPIFSPHLCLTHEPHVWIWMCTRVAGQSVCDRERCECALLVFGAALVVKRKRMATRDLFWREPVFRAIAPPFMCFENLYIYTHICHREFTIYSIWIVVYGIPKKIRARYRCMFT